MPMFIETYFPTHLFANVFKVWNFFTGSVFVTRRETLSQGWSCFSGATCLRGFYHIHLGKLYHLHQQWSPAWCPVHYYTRHTSWLNLVRTQNICEFLQMSVLNILGLLVPCSCQNSLLFLNCVMDPAHLVIFIYPSMYICSFRVNKRFSMHMKSRRCVILCNYLTTIRRLGCLNL